MKYLKSFNESNKSYSDEIVDYLEDIFMDMENDSGTGVIVSSVDGGYNIKLFNNKKCDISDVLSDIEHSISYMESKGFDWSIETYWTPFNMMNSFKLISNTEELLDIKNWLKLVILFK